MFRVSGNNSSVSINGVTYYGDSIQIDGNNIIVNGKVATKEDAKVINVIVNCNANHIQTGSGRVTLNGNASSVTTGSGTVDVQGDCGSVKTMSGSVFVDGSVTGMITTMSGNIKHR